MSGTLRKPSQEMIDQYGLEGAEEVLWRSSNDVLNDFFQRLEIDELKIPSLPSLEESMEKINSEVSRRMTEEVENAAESVNTSEALLDAVITGVTLLTMIGVYAYLKLRKKV